MHGAGALLMTARHSAENFSNWEQLSSDGVTFVVIRVTVVTCRVPCCDVSQDVSRPSDLRGYDWVRLGH